MQSNLSIVDNHGFNYKVLVKHFPHIGISLAYYNDVIIAQYEYGIYHTPITDDDAEWEQYEEKFFEGIGGEALERLELQCVKYFNEWTNL